MSLGICNIIHTIGIQSHCQLALINCPDQFMLADSAEGKANKYELSDKSGKA